MVHFMSVILFCLVICTTKRNLAGLTPVCMGEDLWLWAPDSLWGPAEQNPLQ